MPPSAAIKKRPDKSSGRQIYERPIVVSGLVTGNCQLLFNCFHNNGPFLTRDNYFNTKGYFVKEFFYYLQVVNHPQENIYYPGIKLRAAVTFNLQNRGILH